MQSEALKQGVDADIAQYDGKWARTDDGFLSMRVSERVTVRNRLVDWF